MKDKKQRRLLFGPSIVRRLKEIGNIGLVDSNPLYSSCHVKRDSKTRRKGTFRDLESLTNLERLERLNSLEALQNLEALESTPSTKNKEF